jgi:hypothetical protein
LFLFARESAIILQTTLNGKETQATGTLNNASMIAADATTVYAAQYYKHTIAKILRVFVWSQQTHQHFHLKKRALIKTVILASLCPFGTSQLNKLPRDILFHMLSFLDSHTFAC